MDCKKVGPWSMAHKYGACHNDFCRVHEIMLFLHMLGIPAPKIGFCGNGDVLYYPDELMNYEIN